jgi:hypothetical protein
MIFFALAGRTENSAAVGHRGRREGKSLKKSFNLTKAPILKDVTKATGASSKPLPVPEGVVLDNTPFQQIFVGGLPGKPPQK